MFFPCFGGKDATRWYARRHSRQEATDGHSSGHPRVDAHELTGDALGCEVGDTFSTILGEAHTQCGKIGRVVWAETQTPADSGNLDQAPKMLSPGFHPGPGTDRAGNPMVYCDACNMPVGL